MYAENRAEIDRLGKDFESQLKERAPTARAAGEEYLEALTTFIDAYNKGPAADSHLIALDTTGELTRVEEYVAWAEQERHRVRRAMLELA